jgi:transcriptional regulator with XRE-family HTH domain
MRVASREFKAIRNRLDLSQEQMGRLLGVSFTSVNRWEGGHSSPTKSVVDLYAAIRAALAAGHSAAAIRRASDNERGVFLYALFRMGYGRSRESA